MNTYCVIDFDSGETLMELAGNIALDNWYAAHPWHKTVTTHKEQVETGFLTTEFVREDD